VAGLAQVKAAVLVPALPHEILGPPTGVVVAVAAPCGTGVELRALDAVRGFIRLLGVPGSQRQWQAGGLCNAMEAFVVAAVPVRASEIAQAALAAGGGAGAGGVAVFRVAQAGEVREPTLADLISQLVMSKGLFDRAELLRSQRRLRLGPLLVYQKWGRTTQAMMRVLADALEDVLPDALVRLAQMVGLSAADILRSLRGGAARSGSLSQAKPGPAAVLANPWVIVAALAVLAGVAWITVPLALDALKTVATQAIQSGCLANVLDAAERGVDTAPILRAMPDICKPPDWLTWLIIGGTAAAVGGVGYWWYRRRKRAS